MVDHPVDIIVDAVHGLIQGLILARTYLLFKFLVKVSHVFLHSLFLLHLIAIRILLKIFQYLCHKITSFLLESLKIDLRWLEFLITGQNSLVVLNASLLYPI